MLKIKLSRTGKRNQAHYRVVVAEVRSKRDGKVVDYLGIYDPNQDPSLFKIDTKKYQEWLGRGAIPTPTVNSLAKR